jgi:hypothetical protein
LGRVRRAKKKYAFTADAKAGVKGFRKIRHSDCLPVLLRGVFLKELGKLNPGESEA